MRVAIIGAGLQTSRRAPVIADSSDDEIKEIVSFGSPTPSKLIGKFPCDWGNDWHRAVQRHDVDAVLICTPPHLHAEIAIAALQIGKQVLCEKPLCRTIDEAEAMLDAAERAGRVLKCGFNHRHHPAILEAHRRFELGEFGRPISGRCRYGICGRPGYEKEWRADLVMAGSHGHSAIARFLLGSVAQSILRTAPCSVEIVVQEQENLFLPRIR